MTSRLCKYQEHACEQEETLLPDYEICGYCGFDHSYEYTEAHKWHTNQEKGTTIQV